MSNELLVIIDLQKGFVNDWTRHLPAAVEDLQKSYNSVIATKFINPPGSPYRDFLGWSRFAPDHSDETDLAFVPRDDAKIIEKNVYSAAPEIILKTQELQINEVSLCGIATDNCLLKTAADLFEFSIKPLILVDYCASHGGPEAHQAGLLVLERMIGKDQLITGKPS